MRNTLSGPRVNCVGDFSYVFADRVAKVIEQSGLDRGACYSIVWQYSLWAVPTMPLDPAYNRTYLRNELCHVTYVYNTLLRNVMIYSNDTLNENEIHAALEGALRLLGEREWDK